MKTLKLSPYKLTRSGVLSFFSITSLFLSMAFFCQIGNAQQAQLSLADVLIGLRSKKVTIDERNRLLSDAVKVRGITFSLTPEIETELASTGASNQLVEAIRQTTVKTKTNSNVNSAPQTAPAVQAPVMDFAFYRKRADENFSKNEFDLAINDYTKAIEMNPKDGAAYLNRGRIYASKKSFDLAMIDFDKTIEINPQEATAYLYRAELFEKKGDSAKSMDGYRKVLELDNGNESAKGNLKRLQDEQAKIEQAKVEQAKILAKQKEAETTLAATKTTAPQQPATPKIVEIGSMVGQAVKMIIPQYPPFARQANISGQVTVQITLDEKGEVVSAKATSGPQLLRSLSEDAARKTNFRPFLVGDQAVKATGFIVYKFGSK